MSSVRRRYLVCYDVADPRRLRRIAQTCEGWGVRFQDSVFECLLDGLGFQRLRGRLDEIINHGQDRVLMVDLGPEDGAPAARYTSLGQPPPVQTRVTVI